MVINGYEDDQRLIIGGISTLAEQLARQEIQGMTPGRHVRFSKVNRISEDNGKISLATDGKPVAAFDRVIVTSNNRAMQMVHGLSADETFLNQDVCRAVRETHLTGSSKLFMLTRDKFWLKNKLPLTIQSDGLVRGVYCLDYEPDNPGGPGVVLLSYTWEDDAHKLLAITDKKQRCQHLVDELNNTNIIIADMGTFSDNAILCVKFLDKDKKLLASITYLSDFPSCLFLNKKTA